MANIVPITAVIELNNVGVPDGNVFVADQSNQNLVFQIPSVSSVGGPFYQVNLPTTLVSGAPSTSVNQAFNVMANIPSDFSFPAVGGSMPVSYYSIASYGAIVRDNWTRIR